MKKSTILTLIAMLALVTGLFAVPKADCLTDCKGADCTPRGEHHMVAAPNHNHDDMFKVLELTEEQQKQIKAIHDANQKQRIDLDASIAKKEIDLGQATEKEEFKQAEKLIDEISKLRAQKQKNRLNTEKEVLKILTPEQKEKYKKLRLHRHHRNMQLHKKPHKRDDKRLHGKAKRF